MASKVVIGVFDSYENASKAIDGLRAADFSSEKFSLLGKDTEDLRPVTAHTLTKSPDKLMTNLAIVGAIGGFLVGLITVVVPGLGALVVAGPFLAAISGAAAGGALGVVAGALVHFDVPESEAKIYETHVTEGKILVAVHVENADERYKAEAVMDEFGATEVDTKAA